MNKMTILLAAAGTLAALDVSAATLSVAASDVATVQPGGPRGGSAGKEFFNVEGANNGSFASYGVARFDVSGLGLNGATINSATVSLAQANAFFTVDGDVAVYFSDLDLVDIQEGSSIAYDAGVQFGNDFPDAILLGTDSFVQVADGTVETFDVTSNLQSLADDDGTITLVFAEFADADVAATYAGIGGGQAPTLNIDFQPVPVPAAVWLFGSAVAGLVGMRRRA